MNQLITQIRELAPSAKEPLFRRLLVVESLSYLREKNTIIGFEVDTNANQALSGFTLIAIQKHTIYAYCADLHEAPRLILFPPLEKLFDPAFELLGLHVIKRRFTSSTFQGQRIGSGTLESLVRDLTPPQKEVDVPSSVVEQMAAHVRQVADGKQNEAPEANQETPMPETIMDGGYFTEPPDDGFIQDNPYEGFEESGYSDYGAYDDYEGQGYSDTYDDYGSYGGYETAYEPDPPKPLEDPRSTKLKEQSFESLSEVSDFCAFQLGVHRPLAVTLVNKALQSNVSPEYRIDLAVKLFCKCFDEKKI